MTLNLNKDLTEAYMKVCSLEEQKIEEEMKEIISFLMDEMIREGYEITEEEVRQFCLDEGIPGWLGNIKTFVSGVGKGITAGERRAEALARLKARQEAQKQAVKQTQTATTNQAVQKSAEKTGRVIQAAKSPKGIAAGLTAGTAEFAASGQATGDGKSVAAAIPASLVGGIGNVLKQGGRPLSAVGYPGLERIGGELKKAGSWIAGSNKDRESNPYQLKKENLDMFDTIKGYLLDEGYASTEKQAEVIMANMGEKWKQDILNNISEN